VSGAQFLCQEGLPTGSCPGRCGARIAAVFAVTTVDLALQAAVNDRCAESRSSSTTTTTKTGRIKRWRRSGNALYFDARRSPPTLTVPRSRQRAQSPMTDLRRCRGPPKAQCRFRVTQQRQQPPWVRRAIAGVRGQQTMTPLLRRFTCLRWDHGRPLAAPAGHSNRLIVRQRGFHLQHVSDGTDKPASAATADGRDARNWDASARTRRRREA